MDGTVTCNVGPLDAGSSTSRDIAVEIKNPQELDVCVNKASVSSVSADSNPNNNFC